MSTGGVSVQEGLCPGGALSREVSVQRRGVSVQGALCSGGSLFRGLSVQGVLTRGSLSRGLCQGDPPYGNMRAVRILLECILVFKLILCAKTMTFQLNSISFFFAVHGAMFTNDSKTFKCKITKSKTASANPKGLHFVL